MMQPYRFASPLQKNCLNGPIVHLHVATTNYLRH